MNSLRICLQNIRKWGSNARIKMCFVLVLFFVYSFTTGLGAVSYEFGEKMHPWIFPFLFCYRYIKILFMIPLLFIFCDAPFIDSNQIYVMLRTKRRKWSIGQILYIFVTSFIYELLLLISSIVFNIGNMQWGTTWGKVLGAAGTTNILSSLGKGYDTIMISPIVIRYYKPYQAMILSFVLMWLSFVFLGLLVYVLNVISKTQFVGTLCAGLLILFTAVADMQPQLTKYSPISWNSLNKVDVANVTTYLPVETVMGIYIGAIVLMIVVIMLFFKKQEIIVGEEES